MELWAERESVGGAELLPAYFYQHANCRRGELSADQSRQGAVLVDDPGWHHDAAHADLYSADLQRPAHHAHRQHTGAEFLDWRRRRRSRGGGVRVRGVEALNTLATIARCLAEQRIAEPTGCGVWLRALGCCAWLGAAAD